MSGYRESRASQDNAQDAKQRIGTKKRRRKEYPTQERLKELFDYDETKGVLISKEREFSGVDIYKLNEKGSRPKPVLIDDAWYEYCIILWIWYYGVRPKAQVTHYDFNSLNNRIENLHIKGDLKDVKLTQERVKFLLDYDPISGLLTRRVTTNYKARAGELMIGSIGKLGYRTISLDGNTYYVHRIIWLWYYGYFPENVIDHINNNKLDCSIGNLREVTHQCNSRNSLLQSNNKSGVKGVPLIREDGTFSARIAVYSVEKRRSVTRHLCNSKDFTEAVAHRLAAEQALDWAGCDSNSTAYQYMQNYLQEIRCQTGNKEQ